MSEQALKDRKIYLAGSTGMLGAALVRRLQAAGCGNLVLTARAELDLTDQSAVYDFFDRQRPDCVIGAAAVVGGILANSSYPAKFIADNLMIQTNIMEAARRSGVKEILMFGSGCMYPLAAPVPTSEDALLTGPLEPTNEWYAVAKIACVKMVESYRLQYGINAKMLVPCNLYGPQDNFDLDSSHVVPGLLRKVHEAKESGAAVVQLWGTGTPQREFLHVDDIAAASLHVLESDTGHSVLNVSSGQVATIAELARLTAEVVGYDGDIAWDGKLDGVPRKALDSARLRASGWRPQIELADGLQSTYAWMLDNVGELREVKHEKPVARR